MDGSFSDISNLSNTIERANNGDVVPTDSAIKNEARFIHIPYILNGELYEILTQEGENVTVKCCHCPPDRVYRGSIRSTGNFHMHIKRRHPDLLGRLHDMKVTALLERRDRFLKNRKSAHRQQGTAAAQIKSENNSIDMGHGLADGVVAAQYTHKLKIKTAFQRHQLQKQQLMQQQKQIEQHTPTTSTQNWNSSVFAVPLANINEDNAEPLNLSLDKRTHTEDYQNPTTEQAINAETSSQVAHLAAANAASVDKAAHKSRNLMARSYATNAESSPTSSSLSTVSAYDNLRNCEYIKKELISSPETTIDLTTQTASFASSGIGLMYDDTRARLSAGANHPNCNTNQNCENVIQSVQHTLGQLLNEIRLRNQLDIAKFKYLHPNFQFNL